MSNSTFLRSSSGKLWSEYNQSNFDDNVPLLLELGLAMRSFFVERKLHENKCHIEREMPIFLDLIGLEDIDFSSDDPICQANNIITGGTGGCEFCFVDWIKYTGWSDRRGGCRPVERAMSDGELSAYNFSVKIISEAWKQRIVT